MLKKLIFIFVVLFCTTLIWADVDEFIGVSTVDEYLGISTIDEVVGQTVAAGGGGADWEDTFTSCTASASLTDRSGWDTVYDVSGGTQRDSYMTCETGGALYAEVDRPGVAEYILAEETLTDADYTCQVDVFSAADNQSIYGFGCLARAVKDGDHLDGYAIAVRMDTDLMYVARYDDGSATFLTTDDCDDSTGAVDWSNPQEIKITLSGTTITGYLNGSEIVSCTDATYSAKGNTGLVGYSGGAGDVFFDDFEIYD